MDDIKRLRIFLISRFLQIVAISTIVEIGVVWLVNKTMIAALLRYVLRTNEISSLSTGQIFKLFFALFGQLVLSAASKVFSRELSISFGLISRLVSEVSSRIHETDPVSLLISNMSGTRRTAAWLMMLAAVVLILLPFAVASVLYSRIVVREFALIEQADKEKNEEYERQRNLMLSDIAHDLRTPMTTISGYAKALDDDLIPDEKRHEIYASIQAKSARMNDLIGLLFDYVKLDSEGFVFNKTTSDVCELVRESAAFMYQDLEDAGLELDIDIPERTLNREVDRVQFSRVITNLISNAIKHNDTASRVGVYVKDDVRIMVCDDGAVIDPEYAAHIFEPFVTGDSSRNSSGGSGLGLSIAKKIVSMHGGRISLLQKEELSPDIRKLNYTKAFVIEL